MCDGLVCCSCRIYIGILCGKGDLMHKHINVDRVFLVIILFAVILFVICVSAEHTQSGDEYVSHTNTYGTLTVYEKDSVAYAYQGEINIINDGSDGNNIEILIDIDENMKP